MKNKNQAIYISASLILASIILIAISLLVSPINALAETITTTTPATEELTIQTRAIIASVIVVVAIPILILFKTHKVNNLKALKKLNVKLHKNYDTLLEANKNKKSSKSIKNIINIKSNLISIRRIIYNELNKTDLPILENFNGSLIKTIETLDKYTELGLFDNHKMDIDAATKLVTDFLPVLDNVINLI